MTDNKTITTDELDAWFKAKLDKTIEAGFYCAHFIVLSVTILVWALYMLDTVVFG